MDFLDIHTHKTAQHPKTISIQSLSLTEDIFLAMPKKKPISIGLHPWYATIKDLPLQMKYLRVLARQSNVKLIGECGLDRLKGDELKNQIAILEQQIYLAEELKKPLILHCVRCFTELMEVKERLNVKVPMIIHGFNKNEELGRQLIKKGFLLSFGSSILKEDSSSVKLIKETHDFLLETDEAEIGIDEIYKAVAEIKNCTVEEVKRVIFANWKKLNLL